MYLNVCHYRKTNRAVLFSSRFVYWVKQRFVLMRVVGVKIGCCIKSKKPICIYDNVIGEAHATTSHGGRHKTVLNLILNTHAYHTLLLKYF